MNQVTGLLIFHRNFVMIDPDNNSPMPGDFLLVLRNVPPFDLLDIQDAQAALQEVVSRGFNHGDHVTITGRVGMVHGQRSVLMAGVAPA